MMKNYMYFLSVLFMLGTVLVSCEPKPGGGTGTEPETPTHAELVLGKWNVVLDKSYQSYIEEEDNYQEIQYCSEWADSITIDFVSDSVLTFTSHSGGPTGWVDSWSDPYHFENDTITWDKWKYYVSGIDTENMIMESVIREERTLANGSVIHTAEIKHYEMKRSK